LAETARSESRSALQVGGQLAGRAATGKNIAIHPQRCLFPQRETRTVEKRDLDTAAGVRGKDVINLKFRSKTDPDHPALRRQRATSLEPGYRGNVFLPYRFPRTDCADPHDTQDVNKDKLVPHDDLFATSCSALEATPERVR
jgi:hypothetical protein